MLHKDLEQLRSNPSAVLNISLNWIKNSEFKDLKLVLLQLSLGWGQRSASVTLHSFLNWQTSDVFIFKVSHRFVISVLSVFIREFFTSHNSEDDNKVTATSHIHKCASQINK